MTDLSKSTYHLTHLENEVFRIGKERDAARAECERLREYVVACAAGLDKTSEQLGMGEISVNIGAFRCGCFAKNLRAAALSEGGAGR